MTRFLTLAALAAVALILTAQPRHIETPLCWARVSKAGAVTVSGNAECRRTWTRRQAPPIVSFNYSPLTDIQNAAYKRE